MQRESSLNPNNNSQYTLDESKMRAKQKMNKIKEYSEKLRVQQKE